MKGIIFTNLVEFIENSAGFEIADKMIENAHLENDGAFTQAGSYPFEYLQKLVVSLSNESGKPVSELLYLFGKHLFRRLIKICSKDLTSYATPLDFMATMDNMVHVEVHKLYPDADLPRFYVESKEDTVLVLIYESQKRLEPFAHGLIDGCAELFKQNVETTYETIGEAPHQARFIIRLADVRN